MSLRGIFAGRRPGSSKHEAPAAAPAPAPAHLSASDLLTGRPVGPAFFLSYAHARRIRTGALNYVQDFFERLSDDVSQLLPLPAGVDAGYMDQRMSAGDFWREDVLQALGTCQVFVALLNDQYLSESDWCPMEWHLFARRTVTPRSDLPARGHGAAILPVLWARTTTSMPPIVSRVQRFRASGVSRDFEDVYHDEGLLGLYKIGEHAYAPVIWKIALEIQSIYASFHVTADVATSTDGIATTFDEEALP